MKNTEQLVNEILSPPKKKAANIPIEKLHTFNGHPFKVLDNEEMEILIESIRQQGILSPLIVRPMENKPDEYEVISGHRRLYASVKAGLTEVPALIYPLDRNAAIIAVVDSNIHREQILPSEKANQTEHISFKVQDLRSFFPKNYTQKQMTDTILKLLYDYHRKIERKRNSRDER